jgi:predicted membrane-bound dolichyl-phosphate-mannose-protein mannosyltransferase
MSKKKRLDIKKLFIFLLPLALTLFVFFKYKNLFTEQTNIENYTEKYANSQYVLGEGSPHKIDDATLYIYAGHAYSRGEDPTSINFEHPPLTKYLIGLSLNLFNNPVLLNLPLFFFSLLCVFYLTKKITNKYWLGILGMMMVGNLQILQEHVAQALMDFPQLFLTLLLFTTLFSKLKLKYPLAGVILGSLLSVKYQIPMIFLYIFIVGVWALTEKKIFHFIYSMITMLITYLANYTVYFMNGNSLIDFAKFEWYRFRWFTGDRTMPKFLVFQTLFTGTFKGWWAADAYLTEPSWTIFWPISFIFHLFSFSFWKKFNKEIVTILFYTTIVLAVFSLGSAAYARYLLQLLPFWIIIGIWLGQQLYQKFNKLKNK